MGCQAVILWVAHYVELFQVFSVVKINFYDMLGLQCSGIQNETYDAKRQGPARRCGPGPHVHFRAVSNVTGISGIFRFVLLFLPLRAQFSSNCLKFCMKLAKNDAKVAYFLN